MSSVDESLTQFALTFNFLRTQKAHLCKNPRYGSSARTTSCDIRIPMSRSIEHRSAAAFSKYSYHFFRTSAFLPFVIVACRLITSGVPFPVWRPDEGRCLSVAAAPPARSLSESDRVTLVIKFRCKGSVPAKHND
jgi:hypothetical protein